MNKAEFSAQKIAADAIGESLTGDYVAATAAAVRRLFTVLECKPTAQDRTTMEAFVEVLLSVIGED